MLKWRHLLSKHLFRSDTLLPLLLLAAPPRPPPLDRAAARAGLLKSGRWSHNARSVNRQEIGIEESNPSSRTAFGSAIMATAGGVQSEKDGNEHNEKQQGSTT